jgi:predicted phosphodiesterase|tara:strand:+ start:16 stop:186 length:171 start_codon:yes stop_codon:yes gene_type:complete
MSYEREDYLLIRNDKVIAVSGNADFSDGDNPIIGMEADTVVQVVSNGDEIAYISES